MKSQQNIKDRVIRHFPTYYWNHNVDHMECYDAKEDYYRYYAK